MTESETIEHKKSLAELSEGLVSIAAILNKHGHGELWFGIRNDGSAVGMDVTESTLRKVSQAIAAHIEPKIYPDVSTVRIQEKDCIRVVFSGTDAPYYAHGRAYMRVADEDRQLSAKALESLILRKIRANESWDSEPVTDPKFQLSVTRLRSFVRRAGLPWSSPDAALDNLGLRSGQSYCNATALFFPRKPTLQLRCAVFSTNSGPTLLDQHDYTGDLPSLIDEAEKYILRNIRIGMRLDGMVRIDVPEIPTAALREAIVNAFCHRDYRDRDEVRVAVFPDRVEIRNPGSLPEGFTIADLRSKQISRRRNPVIAGLLQRIHLIEAWGRGLSLILAQAPEARFEQVGPLLITTFPRPHPLESPASTSSEVIPEVGPIPGQPRSVSEGHVPGAAEAKRSLDAQVGEQVGEQVGNMLRRCAKEPQSKRALLEAGGFANAYLNYKRHLLPLIQDGLIERTLPDKPQSRLQRYRLTARGRAVLATRP